MADRRSTTRKSAQEPLVTQAKVPSAATRSTQPGATAQRMQALQKMVGNRAVLQLLRQRQQTQSPSPSGVVQMKHELYTDGDYEDTILKTLDEEFTSILSTAGENIGYNVTTSNKPVHLSALSQSSDGQMCRPDQASAVIDKTVKEDRDNDIIDQYGQLGAMERAVFGRTRDQTYDGGHLIGHQFFGKKADVHGNLLPQINEFNQRSYRFFEDLVTKYIDPLNPTKKQEVEFVVDVDYERDTFTRTVEDLKNAAVITVPQYNAILKSGQYTANDPIEFNSFVPNYWEPRLTGLNPNAKAMASLGKSEGYFYNYVKDQDEMDPHLFSNDDVIYANREDAFGYIEGGMDTTGDIAINSNFVKGLFFQAVPHPLDEQDESPDAERFIYNKNRQGLLSGSKKIKKKSAVTLSLSGDVKLSDFQGMLVSDIDTQNTNTSVVNLYKTIKNLSLIKSLVRRLQYTPLPTKREEVKKLLEAAARDTKGCNGTLKAAFQNLYNDDKLKY